MARLVVVAAGVLAMGITVIPPAQADPPSPYPDISRYAKFDTEAFRLGQDQDNVWFRSPRGLDCGIWADGSFGCTGAIPGAPAGTNQVGWFRGDFAVNPVHFDETQQPRFINPGGLPQRVLPRNSYIAVTDKTENADTTTCAVTGDDGVYCFKTGTWKGAGGAYWGARFLVGPTSSYLGPAPTG